MSSELIQQEPSVMQILSQAVLSGNVDVSVIERLAKLQSEFLDRDAKKAYAEAFAAFKAEVPAIVKDSVIEVKGVVRSKYAKLEQAAEKIIPVLLKHGITNRWKTRTAEDGKIFVTCYLRHVLGHEEEGAQLASLPDNSGSMNSLQGQGSTVSYLERYTFIASCGIVVKDQDNDGRGATQSDKDEVLRAILKTKTQSELTAEWRKAMQFATDKKDGDLLLSINEHVAVRRKEIENA